MQVIVLCSFSAKTKTKNLIHKEDGMTTAHSGDTFSTIRRFQDVIIGCAHCHILWLNPAHIRMTTDDFWLLSKTLIDCNHHRYSAGQLMSHDIHFTSGICSACLRINRGDFFRQRQRKEGHFDCFGSATNGYCDQFSCKYRTACISHGAVDDPTSHLYYRHVFDTYQHNLIMHA